MPLAEGARFADFTVLCLLGSGGMGEVYLVRAPRLVRNEALKILPRGLSGDSDYRNRFDREADAAASLYHPNIVGVHDSGEHDGQLWISMDYVDGSDAAVVLRKTSVTGLPREQVAAFKYVTPKFWAHPLARTCDLVPFRPNLHSGRRIHSSTWSAGLTLLVICQ